MSNKIFSILFLLVLLTVFACQKGKGNSGENPVKLSSSSEDSMQTSSTEESSEATTAPSSSSAGENSMQTSSTEESSKTTTAILSPNTSDTNMPKSSKNVVKSSMDDSQQTSIDSSTRDIIQESSQEYDNRDQALGVQSSEGQKTGLDNQRSDTPVSASIEKKNIVKKVQDINPNALVFKADDISNSNIFTIGDIQSSQLFIIKSGKKAYTYTISIAAGNTNQLFYQIPQKTQVSVYGNRVGLGITLTYQRWVELPKKVDFHVAVYDGEKIYASRKLSVVRAGNGDLYSWADMHAITHNMGAKYVLQNDITIPSSSSISFPNGASIPIGSKNNPFKGTLDGRGYSIKNFFIEESNDSYLGIFAATAKATIQNIKILDMVLYGKDYLGAVAGYMINTSVYRVYVYAEISGERIIGGIAGYLGDQSLVTQAMVDNEISGNQDVGGIAGRQENKAKIQDVFVKGMLLGNKSVGGVVGIQTHSYIQNVYVNAKISSKDDAGGLVGIIGFQDPNSLANAYYFRDILEDINADLRPWGYSDFSADIRYTNVRNVTVSDLSNRSIFVGLNFSSVWSLGDEGPQLQFVK